MRQIFRFAEDADSHMTATVLYEAADTIDVLVAAAEKALYEMRHTIAPRNSFTDAVDALDAALTLACGKE